MKRVLLALLVLIAISSCSVSYPELGAAIDEAGLPEQLLEVGETHIPPPTCQESNDASAPPPCPYLDRWYLSPEDPEETCDLISAWAGQHWVPQDFGRGYCLFLHEGEEAGLWIEVLPEQTVIPPEKVGGDLRAINSEHGALVKVGAHPVVAAGPSSFNWVQWFSGGYALAWFLGLLILAGLILVVAVRLLVRSFKDPHREQRIALVTLLLLAGLGGAFTVAVFLIS